MKYTKIRDVKSPTGNRLEDNGFDLYVPNDFPSVIMKVGDNVKIPSGIKVIVPKDHSLIFFNKSGVALKMGLDTSACVVDPGYRGEINICFNKVVGEPVEIVPGMKIAQVILIKTSQEDAEEVTNEEYEIAGGITERGVGGFGSTGV